MQVNEALRNFIASKGIKQSFISTQTGLPESAISRMLSGDIRLTAENFISICDAIDVSTETIVELAKK